MIFKRRKFKKVFSLILLLLSPSILISCSQKEDGIDNVVDRRNEFIDYDDEDYYPVTISSYGYGKEEVDITFEKPPERVVAVCQSSIETLLALGLEDRIVGAYGLDHEVKDELRYQFESLDYYDHLPSSKEVIQLEADFILAWHSLFGDNMLGDVDLWHERGVKTYISKNTGIAGKNFLENEFEDILNLGKIFNKEIEAENIVEDIKIKFAQAKKKVKDKEKIKTIILELEDENTYRVYGQDSLGGSIASELGADLVVNENGNIDSEDLAKLDPNVIFIVYCGDNIDRDESLSFILNNQDFSSLKAVKDGRVYPIMLGELYASGIRTGDGISSIIDGLYPEMDW